MPKRKREQKTASSTSAANNGPKAAKLDPVSAPAKSALKHTEAATIPSTTNDTLSLQIVTGSYERVLHGFTATFSLAPKDDSAITFSDTFLFSAHASSIRSLAISQPTTAGKRILATGAVDERINLYQISSNAPSAAEIKDLSTSSSLLGSSISENPRNREVGSLMHHSRTVSKLLFPTKAKLFSAAEDNTIAITRVRDWTMLSSIKAPVPTQAGRPSGDTAAPGEVPAGVNDFALHPSMKLMISVGKGERCMRLWNLVTGRKAGVLNFGRALLQQAGEGKYGTGEGRRVVWAPDGERFVVLFERGAVVYGMDSEPVAVVKPVPATKLHEGRFVKAGDRTVLALSTENGRVMFFDLDTFSDLEYVDGDEDKLPLCACVAQIESATLSSAGRIKDFEVFEVPNSEGAFDLVFVTASSDGAVRIWAIDSKDLVVKESKKTKIPAPKQVGTLLGVREVGNRLTCLTGFVMDEAVAGAVEEDIELPAAEAESDSDDSDDE